MTLYELTEREISLLEMLEDPATDKTEVNLLLDASDQEFGRKLDSYATMHERMLADVDMLAKEIQRLQERKKSIEKNDTRLKEAVIRSLQAIGKPKYETKLRTYLIKDCAPKLVIDDQNAVPDEYKVPQPCKINNAKLKAFLKEHGDEDCAYAHLERIQSLTIE